MPPNTSWCCPVIHLALEQGVAGASYHGVAEEGIPMREIMTAIGQELSLPAASKLSAEAPQFLGPIAGFVAMDAPSSSALTQQQFDWHPTQPGLLADIKQAHYLKG